MGLNKYTDEHKFYERYKMQNTVTKCKILLQSSLSDRTNLNEIESYKI